MFIYVENKKGTKEKHFYRIIKLNTPIEPKPDTIVKDDFIELEPCVYNMNKNRFEFIRIKLDEIPDIKTLKRVINYLEKGER